MEVAMAIQQQLWLNRQMTTNKQGHRQLDGDCGPDRILVVLDLSVTRGMHPLDTEAGILAIHSRIQNAARRKHAAGGSYPVSLPYQNAVHHKLIALTEEDLVEAWANRRSRPPRSIR